MFFEYDVWIKSTISIIQGIKKKIIQQKGGPRLPRPTPTFAPVTRGIIAKYHYKSCSYLCKYRFHILKRKSVNKKGLFMINNLIVTRANRPFVRAIENDGIGVIMILCPSVIT